MHGDWMIYKVFISYKTYISVERRDWITSMQWKNNESLIFFYTCRDIKII